MGKRSVFFIGSGLQLAFAMLLMCIIGQPALGLSMGGFSDNADLLIAGAAFGLLPGVVFGIYCCALSIRSRLQRVSQLMDEIVCLACSVLSAHWIAQHIAPLLGATWTTLEPLFELVLSNPLSIVLLAVQLALVRITLRPRGKRLS